MHHASHLALSQKDVFTTIVWNHKAKAITVTLYRTHAIAIAGDGLIRLTHERLSQLRS
jgi:hypothetical protein